MPGYEDDTAQQMNPSPNEMAFSSIGDFQYGGENAQIIGTPPDPPYYMTVRVDRRKKRKRRK